MDRRDEMRRDEEQAWGELRAILDRLTPEQMERPGLPDGWSVKDLLWHLCCWEAEAGRQLARIAAGTYVEQDWDTDALNARYLEEGRAQDLPTVRAELAASRTRALEEFGRIAELTPPAEEWFGESGAEHYREHLVDLRAFADGLTRDR